MKIKQNVFRTQAQDIGMSLPLFLWKENGYMSQKGNVKLNPKYALTSMYSPMSGL